MVEDQVLIAIEIGEILSDLGYGPVRLARTVSHALQMVATEPFRLAVLDYNLGDETSDAVALRLSEASVPFVLVTGYDDAAVQENAFAGVPVVRKPFVADDIRALLADVAGAARNDPQ